nr:MAG TPA: hypothetical protein [Caudoviricetes sp.]
MLVKYIYLTVILLSNALIYRRNIIQVRLVQ